MLGDDSAGYSPAQIIAEAFKSVGYDGLIYGSRGGRGTCVAFFDLSAADVRIDDGVPAVRLFRIKDVSFAFDSFE